MTLNWKRKYSEFSQENSLLHFKINSKDMREKWMRKLTKLKKTLSDWISKWIQKWTSQLTSKNFKGPLRKRRILEKSQKVFSDQKRVKFLVKENPAKFKITQFLSQRDFPFTKVMNSEAQCFSIQNPRMKVSYNNKKVK